MQANGDCTDQGDGRSMLSLPLALSGRLDDFLDGLLLMALVHLGLRLLWRRCILSEADNLDGLLEFHDIRLCVLPEDPQELWSQTLRSPSQLLIMAYIGGLEQLKPAFIGAFDETGLN